MYACDFVRMNYMSEQFGHFAIQNQNYSDKHQIWSEMSNVHLLFSSTVVL